MIETAHEELSKPTRDLSTTRLQSLLELAVKTSSAAQDSMSDNLCFEVRRRKGEGDRGGSREGGGEGELGVED